MYLPRLLLAATALSAALPAHAADALKFGPAPPWVVPQSLPANVKPSEAPVALLLDDEQIALDPGKVTTYHDRALKIQNPQGLTAAGNIALAWDPATETVTVNRFHIIRGGKVIDVLASGQTFTTLRRETNLDAATLDGTLTATIQPEDLQEGDVIEMATTTERSDPVLKDYSQATFANWGATHIDSAYARISWPKTMKVVFKEWPGTPQARESVKDGRTVLELSARDLEPVVPPSGAPLRFRVNRLAEATDYSSWDQVSKLMLPLFQKAAVIPATGPLHDEIEKIRAASKDPKTRAEQALALVENRVRYVALEMGQGGYVPAPAETTWSRRFGDCKAKSVLLLAILQSLGIQAEPVLVNAFAGDVVADDLPLLDFNHAIVRAHIGGKSYWLDGTRQGDTGLDGLQVPDFGWVLPLTANASLVHLVPPPLEQPSQERHVEVDATSGLFAPAAVSIVETYRGDGAVAANVLYSSVSSEQRNEALRDEGKSYFDTFILGSSSVQFEKAKRELTLTIKGSAKLNWKDGWLDVPTSSIGYDPDFDRPPGPSHDAPFTVNHPSFAKDIAVLHLPKGVTAQEKLSPHVDETLAGVEYARTETVIGDTLTVESSERSLIPEIAYKDAVAAEAQLRSLDKDDVYIRVPDSYHASTTDLPVLAQEVPQTADDYLVRGWRYLNSGKYDDAIADFTQVLKLDPKNQRALGNRALAHIWKGEFEEGEKDLAMAEAQKADPKAIAETHGFLAERKGNCWKAIDYYTQALAKDSADAFLLTHRAMCETSLSKDDAAIADFTTLIAHEPKNAAAFAGRAVMETNKRDFEAAKKDIAAAEAIDSDLQAVAAAKAHLAMKNGDFGSVIAIESKWIAENPKDGSRYASRAQTYYQTGKPDLALADTDQAVALGYKPAELRLLRANIFKSQDKNDLVAKEADLLAEENPNSDFALVAAAKSYAAIGQPEKAMQLFDKAIAIKPSPLIYINRADVRPAADTAGKMADLDEALKLEPDNVDALTAKANILTRERRNSEAIAILDRLPQGVENEPWRKRQRAILLFEAGRTGDSQQAFAELETEAQTASDFNSLCWDKATKDIFLDSALKDCQQALKLSPDEGQYLDSLGMVLLKMGKLDDALQAYTQAIAKGSGSDSLMGRAFVYARKGDAAHAAADVAAARKANPRVDEVFAEYGLKLDPALSDKAKAIAETEPVMAKPPLSVTSVRVVSMEQH